MRKKSAFGLMVAALLFASCDNEMIWDYASASMIVRITDDAGTNLLDTTQTGHLFQKGMGMLETSYKTNDKDNPYVRREEPIQTLEAYRQKTGTRAYVGPWAGAVLTKSPDKKEPVLFIGEFNEHSGSGDIELTEALFGEPGQRELTLKFDDGRSVTISYVHAASLSHKLKTKAKVVEKSEGLIVSVDFDTQYSVDYLYVEQ